MEPPPEDADARRERLAAWAADQERRLECSHAGRRRSPGVLRRSAQRVMFTSLQWGDRLFDRRLGTSSAAHTAEHEHQDRLHYVVTPWHVLPRAFRYLRPSSDDTF